MTPLGLNLADYWDAIKIGRSAVSLMQPPGVVLDSNGEQYRWYGSLIEGFDAKQYVQPRKSIKVMCKEIQFSFGATMMACQQAGITAGSIPSERLAVCFGSEMLYSEVGEIESLVRLCSTPNGVDFAKWGQLFISNIYPLWMLKPLPNMAACHIGIALDARGPNNSIVSDESASLMAIHEAYLLIQRGAADVVVVGATGSYQNPTRHLQVPVEHYIRDQVEDPAVAVKPFDKHRAGMASGEGAGCLVLENEQHARDNGKKIFGRVASIASGFVKPKNHRSGSSQAIAQTLELALQRAKISASDLDHVNSNGSGSVVLDATVAEGLAAIQPNLPVVAVQGGMGNLGAATGMCELLASIAAADDNGQSPWTAHCNNADPKLAIDVLREPGRKMQRPYVAKISQTPHGQTAAVVLQLLDL